MSPSFLCLLVFVSPMLSIGARNAEQMRLRGVQTSFLSLYVPSKPFTCLDGSMTIPFEYVNDDYCDCRDGSDEPGTSACPNGRFFCENKGYVGTLIPSHLVGDGVCDCCDGSDEYDGRVTCKNTCFSNERSSDASLLNISHNPLFYPIFSTQHNKDHVRLWSKSSSDSSKLLHPHGLLVDQYFAQSIPNKETSSSLSSFFFSKTFVQLVLIIFCLYFIFINRHRLHQRCRERQKRSVLKYSV